MALPSPEGHDPGKTIFRGTSLRAFRVTSWMLGILGQQLVDSEAHAASALLSASGQALGDKGAHESDPTESSRNFPAQSNHRYKLTSAWTVVLVRGCSTPLYTRSATIMLII